MGFAAPAASGHRLRLTSWQSVDAAGTANCAGFGLGSCHLVSAVAGPACDSIPVLEKNKIKTMH